MSFFDLLESRNSIPSFQNKKLDLNTIEKIASVAMRAASPGNPQSYQILIVTNNEYKEKLASAVHGQSFISNASVVFIFCPDMYVDSRDYGKRGQDLYSIQDATIACTYAQLAAHSYGLESVWVGSFDEGAVSRTLSLKSNLRPIAMLVVGFGAKDHQMSTSQMIHNL